MLDSHSDQISYFGLRDDADPSVAQKFAKVEFVPPSDAAKFCDLNSWTLTVDEPTEPEWWPGVRAKALASLRAIVERMIVRDTRPIVVGGCWAIADGGRISRLVSGRVVHVGSRANLAGADLAGANLAGANLARANLVGANLARAYLAGAYLADANLAGADLAGANLSRAYLADANLARANLVGANLARADIAGADRPSNVPLGWTADANGYLTRS